MLKERKGEGFADKKINFEQTKQNTTPHAPRGLEGSALRGGYCHVPFRHMTPTPRLRHKHLPHHSGTHRRLPAHRLRHRLHHSTEHSCSAAVAHRSTAAIVGARRYTSGTLLNTSAASYFIIYSSGQFMFLSLLVLFLFPAFLPQFHFMFFPYLRKYLLLQYIVLGLANRTPQSEYQTRSPIPISVQTSKTLRPLPVPFRPNLCPLRS